MLDEVWRQYDDALDGFGLFCKQIRGLEVGIGRNNIGSDHMND